MNSIKMISKKGGQWALLIVLVIFSFKNFAQSKAGERMISVDEEVSDVSALFEKIKNETGIEIGYVSHEIDTRRKIRLTKGTRNLKSILEEVFPEADYRILWKEDKVLIKKIPENETSEKRIYGYVVDEETGEKLLGATLYDVYRQSGVLTNSYGYFSLMSESDTALLSIRYLGYQPKELKIASAKDTLISISLAPAHQLLGDITITDDRLQEKVESTESGVVHVPIERIKTLPALIGEVDVIKNIQMLPGVQMIGEGTSVYYVRGGNYDQNLILLDEAPVYNPSHALGFFSVFNGDAIKDLTFYKSHIPVKYGGRLSSVLDIRMKEGNKKNYEVSGGLGFLSSRLSVEGPIVRDRASFLLTGRRTYADFIWRSFSQDEATKNTSIYFYDFNAKMNYKLGEKDQLFLSGFFGRDINKVNVQLYGIQWDNKTITLRWNHLFSNRLFSNTSLIYSKYNYRIELLDLPVPITWQSSIEDYSAKTDFDWYASAAHKICFGFSSTLHNIMPGKTIEPGFEQLSLSDADALEHVVYIDDQIDISDRLNIELGVRGVAFQNKGQATLYEYDRNYEIRDSTHHSQGKIYHTYFSVDPRVSLSFSLNERSSLKASYNLTSQFIHQLQNNQIPFTSFDQWIVSNPNVKPQYAHHVNAGYYRYFKNRGIGLSADVFYKHMLHQIDAADHAQLLLNKYLESEIRTGNGRAYGFEVSLEKTRGAVQGMIGYTYSRAQRTIRDINDGRPYNAPYDKPHTVQAALTWKASRRIEVGMNWIYSSGAPVTLPSKTYFYNGKSVPVYEGRNQYRMHAYHRMDLSATLHRKRTERVKNHSTWVFAIYNTYFRKNPASVFASQKMDTELIEIIDPTQQEVYKTWLFSIVPSITYNFNF